MYKTFSATTISYIVLLYSVNFLEANRRGWNNGGGGNRGNGNRWKQTGAGGFNSWRQQTFKHGNNRPENTFNHNNQQQHYQSFNTFRNPDQFHSTADRDPEVPTVSFSHILSETSCAVPTMGDSSKFEIRCIFPTSDQDEDCSTGGSYVPTGTTTMLRCKPPYVSESGDLRIWACESGVWKGEFKSFSCTHPPTTIPTYPNNQGNGDGNLIGNQDTNKHNNSFTSYKPWNKHPDNNPVQDNWSGAGGGSSGWQQPPPPTTIPVSPADSADFFSNHDSSSDKNNNYDSNKPWRNKWHNNKNNGDKPLIPGLIPGLLDQVTESIKDASLQPSWTNKWPQNENINTDKPLIPGLIPGLLDQVTEPVEDVSVQPPWRPVVDKWKPSTTNTTIKANATTHRPYLPPPPPKTTEAPATDWNSYSNQTKEESETKCPLLSKAVGIKLECLSKSSVPWDPSSFLVSQSDCSVPQKVGTEATYKCEQYYEASLDLSIQYRKCKDDGTWTGGENRFACALECGKSNPVGRVPLITNGEPTYKAQWPWHVALFYQDVRTSLYDYNCGATLINRRVVLTAAHCVTEYYSKSIRRIAQFRLDLGRYERIVDDEFVQTFQAEDIIPHPSYNPVTYDSDIAIIILKGSASVNFHVRSICWPQTQNSAFEELHLSDGSYGTVVGFGKNENGDLSSTLHMAKLKVVSQQECAESFADKTLIKSTTFCAGLKNGTNVCSGDSGGGIYFPVDSGGSSRWYLQGLVSVGVAVQDGSNRCDPTRFSVFTRISPYADWIVRILSDKDAL